MLVYTRQKKKEDKGWHEVAKKWHVLFGMGAVDIII